MPTGYYSGQGKTFSKKMGKWINKKKEQCFDYENVDKKSWALLISFFRWYPDYFYDLIQSPNAKYKLELPQRLMLRIFARYRNVYITGARGLTKTYVVMLSKEHDGIFFPGEKIRYVAPAQKQSAKLASDAFKTSGENFPLMAMWWDKNNDRSDMFKITTSYGSEFTMYAPRGDNSSSIIGEELAQEGEDGFDIETFETDIAPTCRIIRKIHGKEDKTHINLKETYISNASSRQNKAFTTYRATALRDMIYGEKYDGYCLDISWVTALLCNIRDIAYYKKEKSKSTKEKWDREMCALYTGSEENPLIADEVLTKSKKLLVMEEEHCGDPEAIYIVSHDVSYADGQKNAKCADTVLKLTRFKSESKRDKYRKQAVYFDNYDPPKNDYYQAMKLKQLWQKYCLEGGQITPLVIDAHAYGTAVVEELLKPTTDGTRPLRTINNNPLFREIEQKEALPVIYALKATTRGGADSDGDMIAYAQSEFEQGNIEVLTTNILDGVESYKEYHGIKDSYKDSKIARPYKICELFCQQVQNLKTEVSGLSYKEKRKSKSIQRDIWSSFKYALHMAQILEGDIKKEKYKAKSSWDDVIKNYDRSGVQQSHSNNVRSNLLSLRKR